PATRQGMFESARQAPRRRQAGPPPATVLPTLALGQRQLSRRQPRRKAARCNRRTGRSEALAHLKPEQLRLDRIGARIGAAIGGHAESVPAEDAALVERVLDERLEAQIAEFDTRRKVEGCKALGVA